MAQFDERCDGSFAFGRFFAFALAASQFDAIVMDGAFKKAIVVGAGRGDDVILRRLRGKRLQQFLEFALGIIKRRDH